MASVRAPPPPRRQRPAPPSFRLPAPARPSDVPDHHGEEGEELLRACIGAGLVESFFPLHQDPVRRAVWRERSSWLLSPPVEDVRAYFGERAAMYFAWASLYTKMALIPAVPGFLLWVWMAVTGTSIDHNIFAPVPAPPPPTPKPKASRAPLLPAL